MTLFDEKIQGLLQQSALQYIIYKENEDSERIEKLHLFARKLLQKEFVIGFAGHFSAGKSSMINALSGENILATSPIPTSANIVKVHKSDEDFAILYLHNEKPVKFEAGYDIKQVKELSKNGELVSQIEIGHSTSSLPEGVTVMDTPGVDSTDDAHAMSTESALHIADMVFYTMDYNHVQSELNFQFTKQLMKYNPNVYLIVNQIDKHREAELSFEDFKQSVHNSFAAWGVYPKNIFFTSLREKELPNNDFDQVKKIVMDSMNDWQEQLILTAENTLKKLQHEHEAYLKEEKQDRFETYVEIVSEDDWQHRDDILEQYEKLTRQTELFSFDVFDKQFDEKRKDLLANAAIMPADVREKLRAYLESQQEDFKVGGLFTAKKKTAEEKTRRQEEAYASFNHVVQSQITGHMKALMKQALKDVGALTDERAAGIDQKEFNFPFSIIEEQVQRSGVITGDAVLNFANRVSEATKRYFIQTTDAWKIEQKETLEQVAQEAAAPVKLKINAMSEKVKALEHILQIEKFEAFSHTLMKQVSNEIRAESKIHLENWKREHEQALKDIRPFNESMLQLTAKDTELVDDHVQETVGSGLNAEAVIEKALKTANIIQDVQGFKEVSSFLTKKVERLQKRDFTIALF